AARRTGRFVEEIEKRFLRRRLGAKLGAGIIGAVIVIIPSGQDWAGLHQFLKPWHGAELAVFLAQDFGVICVAVNVVAEKEEQVRPSIDNRFPDRLRPFLAGAGTERDSRERWRVGSLNRRGEQSGGEEIPFVHIVVIQGAR